MSRNANPKRLAIAKRLLARPGRTPRRGGTAAWLEDWHRTILSFSQRMKDPPHDFPPGDRPPGTRRSPAQAGAIAEPTTSSLQTNRNSKMRPETNNTNQPIQTHNATVRQGGTNMHNRFTTTALGRLAVSSVALLSVLGFVSPAYATIDNTATAVGTYTVVDDTNSAPDTQNVPVAAPSGVLTVAKSADKASVSTIGEAIAYSVLVTNNGNVTINAITVTDTLVSLVCPTSGTNTIATLAPSASETCTATYNVTAADFSGNGGGDGDIDNTANADGTAAGGVGAVNGNDSVAVTLNLTNSLSIAKNYVISTDNGSAGEADVGDVITYTYTIINTGNVALTNVAVNDSHEGSPVALGAGGITNDTLVSDPNGGSDIGTVNDGVVDTLTAGATITFTYVHTVSQTEFDNQ